MKVLKSSATRLVSLLVCCCLPVLAADTGTSYTQLHDEARRLFKEGKVKEALPLELKAAELKPSEPAAHESLSAIYARLGEPEKAEKEARRVVELRPQDELAHYNLALSLQQLGRHDQALSEYKKAMALGDKGPDSQVGEAQCLLALGRMREAIGNLEALSKRYPQRKEVWFNLAHAYLLYEDRVGAIHAADTALRLDPNYKEAIKFRALLALSGSKYRAALALARRLIQLEPTNPEGYRLAGKIATQTAWSDLAEAQWVMDQALRNVPGSVDIFRAVGTSCMRVAELPRHVDYRLSPEMKANWYKLSETALKQAVKIAPDQAETNLALADLYVHTRRYHEAMPYARRALDLAPKSADAQKTYKAALKSKQDLAGQFRMWVQSLYH